MCADLMVPVGEGLGETKGDCMAVSILSGCMGLMEGGAGGGMSSSREVSASLIWVEGNRMMHLQAGERRRGERREGEREREGWGDNLAPPTPPPAGRLTS